MTAAATFYKTTPCAPPHEWSSEVRKTLCKTFELEEGAIRREKDLALFDIVVTNPPFGSKLPIKDANILEQFDLGHTWRKDKESKKIFKTDRLESTRPPEVLFIERCLQFLKPGGRMGIVLPDAILGAPGIEYASIREWLLRKCKIIASIDLHPDTFQPNNGTQTSVLILQKKTKEEEERERMTGKIADYNIFFAMVDNIGNDKRGNPIYKRDKEGNEILVPEDDTEDLSVNNSAETVTVRRVHKVRVRNDDTKSIADTFLEWKKKEGLGW